MERLKGHSVEFHILSPLEDVQGRKGQEVGSRHSLQLWGFKFLCKLIVGCGFQDAFYIVYPFKIKDLKDFS